MWSVCKTCTSPILREIDEALDKGEPLRDIATRSGISRAALSRHNRKCRARRRVQEYKNASSHQGRLFVRYEGAPEIHRADWREQDCLLIVSYEKKPPSPMLTREEAAELKQQMENRTVADIRAAAEIIPPLIIPGDQQPADQGIEENEPPMFLLKREPEERTPENTERSEPTFAESHRAWLAELVQGIRASRRRCG
jgi:hypothetical protein